MGKGLLVDTNILLRLVGPKQPESEAVRGLVSQLRAAEIPLFITQQNAAEYWNVSTRPLNRNGLAFSVAEAEVGLREIESSFGLLIDTENTYAQWRRLIYLHGVKGVQVHDARLAATVIANKLQGLLSLNEKDFERYEEIRVINPLDLQEIGRRILGLQYFVGGWRRVEK